MLLSANILKNAMGVGIPGTGMTGLPIAIALGASVGKSEYGLEVLKDVTPEDVAGGKQYISEGRIGIKLKEGIKEKLYIEVKATDSKGLESCAVIAGGHSSFVFESQGGKVLMDKLGSLACGSCGPGEQDERGLSLRKVWDFATESPIEEIEFILEA